MPDSRHSHTCHPLWRSLAYWIFVTLAVIAALFILREPTLIKLTTR